MTKVFQPCDVVLVYVYDSGERDGILVEDQVRTAVLFDPESGSEVEVSTVVANDTEYDPANVTVKWGTPSGAHSVIQGVQGYDIHHLEAPNGELYYPVEVYVD